MTDVWGKVTSFVKDIGLPGALCFLLIYIAFMEKNSSAKVEASTLQEINNTQKVIAAALENHIKTSDAMNTQMIYVLQVVCQRLGRNRTETQECIPR